MAALYAVLGSLYIAAIGVFRPGSDVGSMVVLLVLCAGYTVAKSRYGDPRARSVPIETLLYLVYSLGLTALLLRIIPNQAASGDVFTAVVILGAALMHLVAVAVGSALGVAIARWKLRRHRESS